MNTSIKIIIGVILTHAFFLPAIQAEIGRLNPNPNPLQEELIQTDNKSSKELIEDKRVTGVHRQKQREFGEYWKQLDEYIQEQNWDAAASKYKADNKIQTRQIEEIITYTSDRIDVWQEILSEYENQLTQLSVNDPEDSYETDPSSVPEGSFNAQGSDLLKRIQSLRERNQNRKEAVLKKLTATLGEELSVAFMNRLPDPDTYYDRISSVLTMIEAFRFEKDIAHIALKANELMGVRLIHGASGFESMGSPEEMSDQTLGAWGFN